VNDRNNNKTITLGLEDSLGMNCSKRHTSTHLSIQLCSAVILALPTSQSKIPEKKRIDEIQIETRLRKEPPAFIFHKPLLPPSKLSGLLNDKNLFYDQVFTFLQIPPPQLTLEPQSGS